MSVIIKVSIEIPEAVECPYVQYFKAQYPSEKEAMGALKNFADLVRMLGVKPTFEKLTTEGILKAIESKR